jgi:hypothetical protein
MKYYTLVFPIAFVIMACSYSQEKVDLKEEVIERILPESCQLSVTHDQLREGGELKLDFPDDCDSLRIYFPAGGTVTHAGLYKDSLLNEEIASTPSFGLMDNGNNFMTLNKDKTGRFFLNYGSCHWGSRMWIVIE